MKVAKLRIQRIKPRIDSVEPRIYSVKPVQHLRTQFLDLRTEFSYAESVQKNPARIMATGTPRFKASCMLNLQVYISSPVPSIVGHLSRRRNG